MTTLKAIANVRLAREQFEGAGAVVRRALGGGTGTKFSPFLMFDHFRSGEGNDNGFPNHPHRGQETITLMLKGAMAHEDFTGSKGILYPGDLQFMTAGKGIVHSEMPVAIRGERAEGLQLWVDLPQHLRDTSPRYRDLREWEVPQFTSPTLTVRVILGVYRDIVSRKDLAYTPMQYYHVTMRSSAEYIQKLPSDFNTFVYVLGGSATINDNKHVSQYHAVYFDAQGEEIKVTTSSQETAEFVVIAGQILDQTTRQYGPFVASTTEGLEHAVSDFQYSRNGFEPSKQWSSLISKGVSREMIENELDGNWEKRMVAKKEYLANRDK